MSSDRPLAPYPPERVWSFPPPPVPRRWFWVAVTAMIVSALIGVGLIATAVTIGAADAPGLIDDPTVLDTISDECSLMTTQVEGSPRSDDPDAVARTIRAQNVRVSAMIDQIASLPPRVLAEDRPTAAWLNDWRRLVQARESYAEALSDIGTDVGRFEIPRDADGLFITVRMEDALLDPVCNVPDVLLDPAQRSTSAI